MFKDFNDFSVEVFEPFLSLLTIALMVCLFLPFCAMLCNFPLKSELLLSEFPLTEFPLCGFSLASEGLHGFTPAPLVRLFQYWLEGTIKLLCILNEFVCAIDSLQTGDRRGPPMGVAVLQKLN